MKTIKILVEQIEDEACSAEEYAKKAMQYKDEDKALADTFAKLAETELQHVDLLHAQVVRIIKAWEAKGNTAPPEMKAVYDYTHQKSIDHVARVKILINMYYGR